MANVLSTCALAFIVVLANAVPSVSSSYAVPVTAGQWVTLPVPGIVRADAQPADVAIASAGADSVRIYGVRPGTAILTLTTSESVEARPIQVEAPSAAGSSLGSRAGNCPTLAYLKAADPAHVAYAGPDLALDWTPSTWLLEWTPPDVRVLASNVLTTPLQQLGVPAGPGFQAQWHDEWQLIAGDGLGLVGYHFQGAGTLAVGGSVLGPAGFLDAALGGARVSAVALKSQSGQLLSSARAAVDLGPVNVGYATGPAGPTVQFHSGSVSASAGTIPGQGFQVGLGIALTPAITFDSSWTTASGWQIHIAMPIGGGATAAVAPSGGVLTQAGDAGCLP